MEHAGIGPTHVNNFLTTMNIPAVDPKLLRRQERVIGPVIEKVAQESCDTATQDELSATVPGEGITMTYDCGWQKRGRAMNSLTGVGHTIGLHTERYFDMRQGQNGVQPVTQLNALESSRSHMIVAKTSLNHRRQWRLMQ